MKKILLLAALAAGTGGARAQNIAAGTISVGGGIGYSRVSTEQEVNAGRGNSYTSEFTSSRFQFSPAAGYFITDNLAIGLNLNYTAERTTSSGNAPGQPVAYTPDARTILRVGPYVQYYKMLSEQFGVLGTLGAGYQKSNTPGPTTSNAFDTKTNGFYAAVTPGVIFFPISKFGISASIGNLGYERVGIDNNDTSEGSVSTSNFGASFGLSQLQFGGTYFFGR